MSDERYGAGGCVLSDGRFAVFGGTDNDGDDLASCEALVLDNDGPVNGSERWEPLPAMHQVRRCRLTVAHLWFPALETITS
jgi:hypothetical protein